MTTADYETTRRQRNETRAELRRIISDSAPPSVKALDHFGDHSSGIERLRAAWVKGGTEEARTEFEELIKLAPVFGELLSSEPEPRKTSWLWSELQQVEFPDPTWVLPGIIPTGLVALGGRPKIGKSWFALQIACAVGTGGKALDRDVTKGKVLYLALEDGPRRIQKRAQKQRWPGVVSVKFETDWPCLAKGGTEKLREVIEKERYSLIIIDTLTRAFGGSDQMDIAVTSQILGELQRLAQDLDITILLLDHHRKSFGLNPDPIDDLFGSTGKAIPLDAALGLYRERGKKEAKLMVASREAEEITLDLIFDGEFGQWEVSREPGGVKKDSSLASLLAMMRKMREEGEMVYAASLARRLGLEPSNVSKLIARAVAEGRVVEGPKQGPIIPLILVEESEEES